MNLIEQHAKLLLLPCRTKKEDGGADASEG